MRRALFFVSAIALAAAFAGCASHGMQSFVPGFQPEVQMGADAVTPVTVKITVATKSAAVRAGNRMPRYFSASSAGLLVAAYMHGKTKVLAQTAVDISPGSKACGRKKTTPRTCSATLMLAPSKGDDFVVTDYTAKPVAGKIPKSAKLLGYGKLTNKKISTIAAKNAFSVYLGGVVAGLSGNAGFVSLPGDGSAHSLAIVIHPADFGNRPITAGKNDPFANPIVVTVAETGGTGHMLLSLNGGTGKASVTAKYSTDAIELQYDGKGAIGYGATVSLAAAKVSGSGGASETVQVGALLLAASSASEYAAPVLSLRGNGDWQSMSIGELSAPIATAYTVTPRNCYAIASALAVSGSGASASFPVLARGVISTPAPGTGCVLAVSDGTSTVNVAVKNSYSGVLGSTTPAIVETPVPAGAAPNDINVGPDGAMWFTEPFLQRLGRITATGSNPQISSNFAVPLPNGGFTLPRPGSAVAGSDGNVWWTDFSSGAGYKPQIGKMSASGNATAYLGTVTSDISYAAIGADGAMWFTECDGNQIGRITTDGNEQFYSTNLTAGSMAQLALGPDGNLWFTEVNNSKIGKITPGGTITEYPTLTPSTQLWGITAGPDGAMWFVECSNSNDPNPNAGAIGRIDMSGNVSEYYTGMSGTLPQDITTGPDGALWFTYFHEGGVAATTLYNKSGIGRIDPTTHVITEYVVPTANSNPLGIASGPDGAIWLTEENSSTSNIGRVPFSTSSARPRARRRH